jgi:CBS domain-containing protein
MIVSEIMTKMPITVYPETTIADAVRLMLAHHINGLPVINDDGCLVGLLTESELLRRPELGTDTRAFGRLEAFFCPISFTTHYVHTHGRKVCNVMKLKPVSVKPGTLLIDAVNIMQCNKVECLPVLNEKKLVGVIGQGDLLRTLARKLAEGRNKTYSDQAIRDYILNALAHERWAPKSGINVAVNDGIVCLKGTVFSQGEREAVRLVAENAPGVRIVQEDFVMWHTTE